MYVTVNVSQGKSQEWNLTWLLMNLLMNAAAKSLQSCPTLCDPIDGSPPGSPVPGILQARTLEWVAISFSTVLLRECVSSLAAVPSHLEEPRGLWTEDL